MAFSGACARCWRREGMPGCSRRKKVCYRTGDGMTEVVLGLGDVLEKSSLPGARNSSVSPAGRLSGGLILVLATLKPSEDEEE